MCFVVRPGREGTGDWPLGRGLHLIRHDVLRRGRGEIPGKQVESASAYLRYAEAGNSKCFPGLFPGPASTSWGGVVSSRLKTAVFRDYLFLRL
jgi:hypothetical protein